MTHFISIIVPVVNEQSCIVAFLEALQCYRKNGHEVILVDGSSSDDTIKLAANLVDMSLLSAPGRARQMNLGAKYAKNSVLLFLHSDTYLPKSTDSIILNALSSQNSWGRFNVKLDGKQKIFRIIERLINLRSKLTNIATGDQAIFINKEIFDKVNGYPEILLMEDIALSKILRQQYTCCCLANEVTTSSRRWEKNGVLRTIVLMWKLRLLYFIGTKPDILYKLYYEKK